MKKKLDKDNKTPYGRTKNGSEESCKDSSRNMLMKN
jgi:hypothetical protein